MKNQVLYEENNQLGQKERKKDREIALREHSQSVESVRTGFILLSEFESLKKL